MLEQYKPNTLKEVEDLIYKLVQDEYLKVSELAKLLNSILYINEYTAKKINELLIIEGAMVVNNNKSINSKYVPTERGEEYAKKIIQSTYTYYIWKPSFVFKLLNIDFKNENSYEDFLRIKKKIFRCQYSNIFINNMKIIKSLIEQDNK